MKYAFHLFNAYTKGKRIMAIHNRSRRIWLVRHGITQWNSEQRFCGHSDIPISAEGRRQAQWLARRLSTEQITAIYSSDLLRAQRTAEIIASPHSLQVNGMAAWREISFGDWEGLTYGQIELHQGRQPEFFRDPVHFAPPGGESLMDLTRRVQKAFIELVREQEGAIVLVSHGGPLRALLCCLLAMPLERQWQLRIDHGSLSALDVLPSLNGARPTATLALLNEQGSVRLKRIPTQYTATEELTPGGMERHEEGSIHHAR
jgi:alpha-ribazole phosphatase